VFQLMKKHYSRYTPELVSRATGTPKEQFLKVCEMIAETAAPDKTMTICYALGWTQHTVGSQNIRTMAMIQLLLGNMGMAGGGINALRGHSNVQGITDMCAYSETLPGYLSAPTDADVDRKTYLEKRTPKALRPNQMNFPQNFPKWFTSLQKAWFGNAATPANDFCYDWLPKKDAAYDVLAIFERMHQGKMNGFVCQGFNPLAAVPNKKKVGDALAKLKYLVIIDPLATDTSEFWKDHGEYNSSDAAKIQTEVFRLPCNLFAEETGSYTNVGPRRAVALAGGGRPGRSDQRHRGRRHAVPEDQGDVPAGRRQASRAHPQPHLALPLTGQAVRRGAADGDLRQGAFRRL